MWNVGLSRGRAEQTCHCTTHVGWNVLFNLCFTCTMQIFLVENRCHLVTWYFPLAMFHLISLQAFPLFAFYLEGKVIGKGITHHKLVLFCQERSNITWVWWVVIHYSGDPKLLWSRFCPRPSLCLAKNGLPPLWGCLGWATLDADVCCSLGTLIRGR